MYYQFKLPLGYFSLRNKHIYHSDKTFKEILTFILDLYSANILIIHNL